MIHAASAGFGFLQFCNLNSFRTKFILGFSFFMGISVPQYFREYYHVQSKDGHGHSHSGWVSSTVHIFPFHDHRRYLFTIDILLKLFAEWFQFNDIVKVIFMSHATVAAIVALILDCSLSRENDSTRKDSGLHWWEKFSLYGSDVRNDEFYALPCRLDTLFPAVWNLLQVLQNLGQ